jgi:hypothetical protein
MINFILIYFIIGAAWGVLACIYGYKYYGFNKKHFYLQGCFYILTFIINTVLWPAGIAISIYEEFEYKE